MVVRARQSVATENVEARRSAVVDALREVSRRRGVKVGSLSMVGYQSVAGRDPALPSLVEVFSLFGGWKAAVKAAHAAERDA
jgi:hypothetical protein